MLVEHCPVFQYTPKQRESLVDFVTCLIERASLHWLSTCLETPFHMQVKPVSSCPFTALFSGVMQSFAKKFAELVCAFEMVIWFAEFRVDARFNCLGRIPCLARFNCFWLCRPAGVGCGGRLRVAS